LSEAPQVHLQEPEAPGISLPLDRPVNALTLLDTATEAVRIHFDLPAQLPVYGFSLDGHTGLYLDNFPSRGNSGMNLIDIPATTLQGFQDHLEYDLVVLQFGLNVIAPQRKSFRSYQRGMRRVIEHFQTHMPEADILLVGVGDKSTMIDGRLQTDPSVPLVVAAQRELAAEMGVGFVDLYAGMGGHNAMIRWVKDRLARSDHAHPTRRGAKVIAGIIYDHLIGLYQEQTGEVLPQAGEMAAHRN
jgi:lysophospholipase L1-like esterase